MSESLASPASPFAPGAHQYALSSDLSRLCLPAEFRETHRRLAWVNSICFVFLVVGLIGIKPPRVVVKPLSKVEEVVPVVFVPAAEQPKPEAQAQPKEPEPQETPAETPEVVTIVAAAPSPAVAFPIPVQGAVATVQDVRHASAPPPADYQPPQPVKFDPNAAHSGSFPAPTYPYSAVRNRYQGTVVVEFKVDTSGAVSEAKVQKSSGFKELDDAALTVVKTRWRFPAGKPQWLVWPCQFVLQ